MKRHALKNYRYRGKLRFASAPLITDPGTKRYRCKVVLFPRYVPHGGVRIKKIADKKALNMLSRQFLTVHEYPEKEFQEMFWSFYALIKKARCFELLYNDNTLAGVPPTVNRLIES